MGMQLSRTFGIEAGDRDARLIEEQFLRIIEALPLQNQIGLRAKLNAARHDALQFGRGRRSAGGEKQREQARERHYPDAMAKVSAAGWHRVDPLHNL